MSRFVPVSFILLPFLFLIQKKERERRGGKLLWHFPARVSLNKEKARGGGGPAVAAEEIAKSTEAKCGLSASVVNNASFCALLLKEH
jgi:hypothetical protein